MRSRLRLGHPQRPLSLRFALRDVYNSKLEATVAWGPPEDSVRALLGRASSPDAAVRGPALAHLRSRGEVWNRDGALPRAPERSDSPERYLEAWRQWYREVITFPTGQ